MDPKSSCCSHPFIFLKAVCTGIGAHPGILWPVSLLSALQHVLRKTPFKVRLLGVCVQDPYLRKCLEHMVIDISINFWQLFSNLFFRLLFEQFGMRPVP